MKQPSLIGMVIGLFVATLLSSCELKHATPPKSDVALIYAYIITNGHRDLPVDDAYVIATRFRKFSAQTDLSAFQAIRGQLQESMRHQLALLQNTPGAAACLATANMSTALRAFQQQAAQTPKRKAITVLTFSNQCLTQDGKEFYYVEQVGQGSPGAQGSVYVVNKGVVEREILIWTT